MMMTTMTATTPAPAPVSPLAEAEALDAGELAPPQDGSAGPLQPELEAFDAGELDTASVVAAHAELEAREEAGAADPAPMVQNLVADQLSPLISGNVPAEVTEPQVDGRGDEDSVGENDSLASFNYSEFKAEPASAPTEPQLPKGSRGLPEGWRRVECKMYNRPFYHNLLSRESTWIKPTAAATLPVPTKQSRRRK